MNIPELQNAGIQIYGDIGYRNADCPVEDAELITFMNWLAREYPEFPALHVKNEKKRRGKGFLELANERKKGSIVKGWPDVVICGFPTLFIEMKRKDHTLSSVDNAQVSFLQRAGNVDCWAVVALGYVGAQAAFMVWLKENYPNLVKKACNQKSAKVISITSTRR